MKIRMLIPIASQRIAFAPGDETDYFSDAECKRLIAKGYAEEVKPVAVKKAAVKRKPAARKEG